MSRTPPTTSVEIVLNIVLFFSQYALRSMNEFFRTLTFSYVYDVMRLCQGHCRGYQFQWPQQRLVYSPVKHQRRSFFLKIANRFQRVTICIKISIIDLRQGPKYAFDKKFKNSKLFHVRVATLTYCVNGELADTVTCLNFFTVKCFTSRTWLLSKSMSLMVLFLSSLHFICIVSSKGWIKKIYNQGSNLTERSYIIFSACG